MWSRILIRGITYRLEESRCAFCIIDSASFSSTSAGAFPTALNIPPKRYGHGHPFCIADYCRRCNASAIEDRIEMKFVCSGCDLKVAGIHTQVDARKRRAGFRADSPQAAVSSIMNIDLTSMFELELMRLPRFHGTRSHPVGDDRIPGYPRMRRARKCRHHTT